MHNIFLVFGHAVLTYRIYTFLFDVGVKKTDTMRKN